MQYKVNIIYNLKSKSQPQIPKSQILNEKGKFGLLAVTKIS